MALSKRGLNRLAEVYRFPLKPLAEHLFANTEPVYLCELHTHEGEEYIHVYLHKLMLFTKGVSFYYFTTLLKMYLMYMSDTVRICLEEYELRQRMYKEEGRYKTATHQVGVPYQISVLFKQVFLRTL